MVKFVGPNTVDHEISCLQGEYSVSIFLPFGKRESRVSLLQKERRVT